MKIQLVTAQREYLHVRCKGAIDLSSKLDASDPLSAILVADAFTPKTILMDFDQVPTIDSMGIAWLIRWEHRLKRAGGRLALYGVVPRVLEVLQICKMELIISIYDSEQEAKKALGLPLEDEPARLN